MNETTDIKPSGLHAKIAAIVQAVDSIEQDGYNKVQHYGFVSESAFLTALRTEMATRKVTMFPRVVPESVQVYDRSVHNSESKGFLTTCIVAYTFTDAETGESATAEILTQGYDTLDKGAFKAMTGGIKYALRQVYMIPTGDDVENADNNKGPARIEDTLQMEILPEGDAFRATVRQAKWVKAQGVDKILAIVGVANTDPNKKDAGEMLWLEPEKPDFDQFVAHVCDGMVPPVGSSLDALTGRPFEITVSIRESNGKRYRNHTISAASPVVEVAAA